MSATAPDAGHYRMVANAILEGKVVPVLGAGANLCDRLDGTQWEPGRTLPTAAELAARLVVLAGTKVDDEKDLLRVSQAVLLDLGPQSLYDHLRAIFARSVENRHEPTSLHTFLAGLPAMAASVQQPARPLLIVTTNYDDLLERAFGEAEVPFDLVYYLAQGEPVVKRGASRPSGKPRHKGRFVHVDPDGKRTIVANPKKYLAADPDRRTVILKVHGAAREPPFEDSWVITEDHYIDYLTRTNLNDLFPVNVLDKLVNNHLLFLGYAMKDWNLRVILHRIWTERGEGGYESWAVQIATDTLDVKLWNDKDVNIQTEALSTYIGELRSALEQVMSP